MKIQLYRINPDNGFRNVSDRVGQDRYHISNIKGAYFIPYAMYDDRHNSSCPEKVLTLLAELLARQEGRVAKDIKITKKEAKTA